MCSAERRLRIPEAVRHLCLIKQKGEAAVFNCISENNSRPENCRNSSYLPHLINISSLEEPDQTIFWSSVRIFYTLWGEANASIAWFSCTSTFIRLLWFNVINYKTPCNLTKRISRYSTIVLWPGAKKVMIVSNFTNW